MGREAPVAATAPAHPDVVLVTLDTVRADHLGAIGGARRVVNTPRMDALAASGALFTRGVAPVPLTLPAHAGMLTGTHPLELGLVRNGQVLGEGVPTVAEAFRAAGWRTGAVVSSAVLRAKTGLNRGFDRYDDRFDGWDRLAARAWLAPLLRWMDLVPVERRGDAAVAAALDWLAEAPGPSFLWVHLYDAHAPYKPPAPYDTMYAWDSPEAQGNHNELRALRAEMLADNEVFAPFVPPDLRATVARYAGEISWTDAVVGLLLDGLSAETAVVVAADHGESLTEHGVLMGHGSQVYDTQTRVPVLVRATGRVPAGARVEAPVPAWEVGSTLLALGDLACGASLLDRLGPSVGEAEILSFAGTQQSRDLPVIAAAWEIGLRRGSVKWVARRDGSFRRFDLGRDPGELRDEASAFPEEQVRIAAKVAEIRARLDAVGGAGGAAGDEELQALGYRE